jgi:hypothetical protein
VREPARAAAGEHEPDRLAREPAGEPGDVVRGQVGADQVVRPRPGRPQRRAGTADDDEPGVGLPGPTVARRAGLLGPIMRGSS